MYTFIRYRSVWDEVVDFNVVPDPEGFFSTESLTHEINPRATRRGKAEANGSWPTFTYYESMTITLEGRVIANTVEDFNTFLSVAMQKLMPDPLLREQDRASGTFIVQKVGFNRKWEVPVTVDVPLQVPITGQGYANQAFHISFLAFRPFYYEPQTNRYIWPT